jgi:hypothetical protein
MELKNELTTLSASEQAEVSAFLFQLRHKADSTYQADLNRRLDDKDASHWLTLDEVEKRLN